MLFSPYYLLSQTLNKRIEGIVLNPKLEVIPNATIKIVTSDTNGLVKKFTFSNEAGKFIITVPTVSYPLYLQISIVGYTTYSAPVTDSLTNGIKQFMLLPLTKDLPEVHVIAEQAITKHGDTTSFKVAAFEKGNESNLSDLLRKLPGMTIDENGKANYNGKPISRVLLENDDLLGSDYAAITNNSGISGIERIDVIENYKDNSRLDNAKAKGTETVLNLQYKKKLLRLFGNTSLGGSLTNYEAKTSNTGILRKHKFLLTANVNSVGNLAARILGMGNNVEPISNTNEQLPQALQFYTAPVQFYDTKPLTISDARLFTNASNLITLNHLFRPVKNLSIKINANYLYDSYSQMSSSKQTINTASTAPLVIEETNTTSKHNQLFNCSGEINWLMSKSAQTILQYNSNYINLNQSKDGTLFSSINGQQVVEKKQHQFFNLITTKLFGENKILNLQLVYNTYNVSNAYSVLNPLPDTSFGVTTYYNHLLQVYQLPSTLLSAQLKYQFKIGKFNGIFKIANNNEQITISNRSILYNKIDSLVTLPVIYNGSMNLGNNQSTASFGLSKEFSKKISASFNIGAQYLRQSLSNTDATYSLSSNIFITPSLSSQYRLSNKQSAFFNVDIQPVYPSASQLYNAYVFTGLNSINKGTNQFNYHSSYGVTLGYFFIDPIQSGIIYNMFISVRNTPPNYLTSISNRGLLIFNDFIPFNEKNQFLILSNKIEKNLGHIKSYATLSGSFTQAKLFSSTNNTFIPNHSISYSLEGKFRTNWHKWFNANVGLLFKSQSQKSTVGYGSQSAIKNSDIITNATISLKINNQLFIDFQNDYYINHSYNTSVRSLYFANILAKYLISKRFSASLSLHNIFNETAFTKTDISPTQTNVSDFGLRPFWAIVSLQMKF
jgi:hypothetical protein